MANHLHTCYACNAPLIERARSATHKTLACESCNFSIDVPLPKTAAQQQAAYRARKRQEQGLPPVTKRNSSTPKFNKAALHGRTTLCPLCTLCGALVFETDICPNCKSPVCRKALITHNVSETIARKGCTACRRRFDYIRTDTPQGRALRTRIWRKQNAAQEKNIHG